MRVFVMVVVKQVFAGKCKITFAFFGNATYVFDSEASFDVQPKCAE